MEGGKTVRVRLLLAFLFIAILTPALLAGDAPPRAARALDDFPRIAKNQTRPGDIQTFDVCPAYNTDCDLNNDTGDDGVGYGNNPCVRNSQCSCGAIECQGSCRASTYGCKYMTPTSCIACS